MPITTSITSSFQRLISVLPKAGNPGNRMETRSLQLSGHKTGPVALSAHPPIHIYGNVHSQAGMLLKQTSHVALLGVALGTAASIAVSRALTSLLYEVAPTDPTALALAPAMLMFVALVAALVPACRATRIDPDAAGI